MRVLYDFVDEHARAVYDDRPPSFCSSGSVGADLRYCSVEKPQVILSSTPFKFATGVKIAIPEGCCGFILPRSGLAALGCYLVNSPGLIDTDYRGEVRVLLAHPEGGFVITDGDRIAQLLIVPAPSYRWVEAELDRTTRGCKGFGSSGR